MSFQSQPSLTTGDLFSYSIDSEAAGQRLDRYLTQAMQEMSRTVVQQLIVDGAVLVNDKTSKPGYVLRAGDAVQVTTPGNRQSQQAMRPLALDLDIIYEDNDILVVNKPAGLVVHPAPGHRDDTLVNALLAYLPQASSADSSGSLDAPARAGIIHRLDKDTSGLLIVAKNARAQQALVEQMKRREIVKRYLALVDGVVSPDRGSIDAPIGRDPRNRQQMAITAVGSRDARTHFQVVQRFARHTLLLLQLETGRTHQIRLHLKAIGHPVVADPVYGSGNVLKHVPLHRQFLHASQLQFRHPITGQQLELEAPLPDDLRAVLAKKEKL
ncbi:MAG TPA: RluA family pseudouridine synthase [Ktedonobacteraceae bacterium]|nr:RluA family pseudouridine synthase [Ktedonobacteraceae bacterium]